MNQSAYILGAFPQRTTTATDEWLTPPNIIKSLGTFDLDPCSPVRRPWDTAREHYTINDDGLSRPWHGRIWLNPPYGKDTGKWLRKLAEHGDGIALVFARTETKMFFESVWPCATSIFFLEGRLSFYEVTGSQAKYAAGAPSVLIAYGKRNDEALRNLKMRGFYCPLPLRASSESAISLFTAGSAAQNGGSDV